ncbi:hypothetical protein [Mycolicibacterium alvei]|jgi:hypothetical protein|nr:hypothetical protein [Mycolicibacterium alvei]MCV7000211.1 hypothetical protein [Mycolicibacterium alvei]
MSAALVGRRMCAVIAVCSVALHGVLLAHASTPAMAVVMAAMMIACLYCARDLWWHGTLGVWCAVALMNLAMVALHMPAPGHHHTSAASTQGSTTMALATMLALLEVVIAAGVLSYRTRNRSVV